MSSRGYKFGKAIAGNLIIIVTVLFVAGGVFWLLRAPTPQVAERIVIPTPTAAIETCQEDRGERLKKSMALFLDKQFDQATDMLYACINSLSPDERDLYVKALTAGNEARAKLADKGLGWAYSDETDPMTSKTTSAATLQSSNSLNLDSPYSGTNHAALIIRKHPRYGTDVIFRIDKGQLMCSTISGCPIKVRFDDGAPMNFTGTEPADNDPAVVFINEKHRFITAAAKAKNILVQVNIYHNGAPVLEFYTPNPLTWKPAK